MLNKIKSIAVSALAFILFALYFLYDNTRRKLSRAEREIEDHKQKIEEQEFINNEKDKTEVNRDDVANMSSDDVKRMYDERGWFKD